MRFCANSDFDSGWAPEQPGREAKFALFYGDIKGTASMPPKRSLWQGNFLRLTVVYLPETTAERRREDAARRYGLSSDFSCFPFSSPSFSNLLFSLSFFSSVSVPLITTPLSTLVSMRRWQRQRSLTDLNVFVLIPTPLMRCFRRQRANGREGGGEGLMGGRQIEIETVSL